MGTKKNLDLLSWKQRKNNLLKIKRYHKFTVMFYRTNNYLHSKRVAELVEAILPFIENELYIDRKLSKLIANHHDDLEIILEEGDIPLQQKLMMNNHQLSHLKEKELLAIETLSLHYPKKIKGYIYETVAKHAIYKDCAEAQLVSFCDKVDGLCEAIHEVLAGNIIFLEPIINYYNRTFNRLKEQYPLIKNIFDIKNVWFDFSAVIDLRNFFDEGIRASCPHNIKNINIKTSIPYYEKWKEVTIKKFRIDLLTKQTEFHTR